MVRGLSVRLGTLAMMCLAVAASEQCPVDKRPQIFIMSDINNEPDDAMSFVRALVHSDMYNITGMVASTSYWLNDSVAPEEIRSTTQAYGQVIDNLNKHSRGVFPTEAYLTSIIHAGQPVYGMAGINLDPLSSGASHLINVVDGMAEGGELLHCQAWGGLSVLGEALAHIQRTRTQPDVQKFIDKLRIYAISDQDDVGPWIRYHFPSIPYIVSIHGFNQYALATWHGISGEIYGQWDRGGPNTALVNNEYVKEHLQIGPLGAKYPDIAYIMEGDSPSLLHTFQNGLNGGPFDHPEWGGWGGRYILYDPTRQSMLYSDTTDLVTGMNNETFVSNKATIWRWRQAFQDEFSARMQWTVLSDYNDGSHPPVVYVNGSCGSAPLEIDVEPEQTLILDATETYDPDADLPGKNPLKYNWFQYRDIGATQSNTAAEVPQLNFTLSDDGTVTSVKMPTAEEACLSARGIHAPPGIQDVCQQYHIILEVLGSGTPPIHRYKRTIVKVQPPAQ